MTIEEITEIDLHAYVDGELSASRRAVVEAWLPEHPEAFARVESYRRQKDALRQLFDPVLDEALPERIVSAARPSPRRMTRWAARIAAGVMLALLGGVAGWHAHDRQPLPSAAASASLPRQAAIAHVVFSPDIKRPVEIGAEHEDQLVVWLSRRLGTTVRPPRLGALGFELIGGRLLPGSSGPVAQFMYHDASGQRLTLYVSNENVRNRDTAFRFAEEGPVNVFYWIDGNFGYAISAGLPRSELARVATAVYDQLQGISLANPRTDKEHP